MKKPVRILIVFGIGLLIAYAFIGGSPQHLSLSSSAEKLISIPAGLGLGAMLMRVLEREVSRLLRMLRQLVIGGLVLFAILKLYHIGLLF